MTFDVATLESLNDVLATGGLLLLGVTIILAFDLRRGSVLTTHIKQYGLKIAFVISSAATVLTLIYSELFGITPCGFCWLERMALYPQLILIPVALYYKDVLMPRYGIALSGIGLLISLYHHYIQMGGSQFIACPTAGADCAKRFLFEYGFVTFPLLSAILFAFLIVVYLAILKNSPKAD